MGYDHQHVPLLSPQDGYRRLGKQYSQYHQRLNQWDAQTVQRYLPRNLTGLTVLDLGGGDGRWAVQLQNKHIARRLIVDQSEELLSQAPARVETVQADLGEPLPIQDRQVDLVLVFFVLLHLSDLEMLFAEAHRVLKDTGRMLIVHHYERRPYLHRDQEGVFKIQTRHRSCEQIEEYLHRAGRQVDLFRVDDQTKLYCCFL